MILQMPYSYPIDIWDVGCMVWDLCQGGHLFEYDGPKTLATAAELAKDGWIEAHRAGNKL